MGDLLKVSTAPSSPATGGGFSTGVYVDAAGDDTTGERGNPLKPFLTLSAALTASSSGDTIFVGPGTFSGAFTWLENRTLIGSGVHSTVLGNLTFSPSSASNAYASWHNCTLGTVTVTSTKTGTSVLQIWASNLISGAVAFSGRSDGRDRIIADTWSAPSTSFTLYQWVGVLNNVSCDGNLDVTAPSGTIIDLIGCEDDGGTLEASGSGTINIAGCVFGYMNSNNDGTRRMTGTTIVANTSINSTSALYSAGCFFGGTFSRAAGATSVDKGSVFANSGTTRRGTDLVLDLTYHTGTIIATAAITLTLPAAPHAGLRYTCKAADGVATLTIARNGKDIEGASANYVIGALECITLEYDGTEWWII